MDESRLEASSPLPSRPEEEREKTLGSQGCISELAELPRLDTIWESTILLANSLEHLPGFSKLLLLKGGVLCGRRGGELAAQQGFGEKLVQKNEAPLKPEKRIHGLYPLEQAGPIAKMVENG